MISTEVVRLDGGDSTEYDLMYLLFHIQMYNSTLLSFSYQA